MNTPVPPKAPPHVQPGWITLHQRVGPDLSGIWPVIVRADTVIMLRPNPHEGLTGVFLIGGASVDVVESVMEIEIGLRSATIATATHVQFRRVA